MIQHYKDLNLIIAIDGFSSCGKSTFARAIARCMGYAYVDTGAMYRAVTLFLQREGILQDRQISDMKALEAALKRIDIRFVYQPEKELSFTYLNGENVEEQIRDKAVANRVSVVAAIKEVRSQLVEMQRIMGREKRIVLDGRDIGTVVFPQAEIKIFMTAEVGVRAKRRYEEIKAKGIEESYEDIERNISERDFLDQNRAESPLKKADDAFVLDNSYMTPANQLEWFEQIMHQYMSK